VFSQSKTLRRAFRIGIATVLAISALRPLPVIGNTFGAVICDGSLASQCVADDWLHWYYISNLSGAMENSTAWVAANVYDPIQEIGMIETTVGSNADVMLTEGSYGLNGYRGWTQCDSNATYGGSGVGRWCKAQLIRFNSGAYPGEFNVAAERRFVICHEVGHTLGLHHRTGDTISCMKDVPLGYSGTYREDSTQHDIDHLNEWYQ
jgi:hypothetical protein